MGDAEDERACVLACQNGDDAAFEKLIRNYQRMIHSVAFRMTSSMSDAEDLAQETFIQAFQRIGDFRGDAAFSSWLYRIAMNKCLNWRKREARRDRLHQEWGTSAEHGVAPADAPSAEVQAALMKLHPKQRAAVVLTICEGQSHGEAAQALGCSETTVSWRVFAAKRKLRRWLAAKGRP